MGSFFTDKELFIFGGKLRNENAGDSVLGDMWILNMDKLRKKLYDPISITTTTNGNTI